MGLLDGFGDFLKSPEGQGLLSGVMGYAANARQGTPWNNLGRGGLAGLSGYSGALDRQQQAAEAEQMKKYRDMQMQQQQMQVEAAKKAQADKEAISGIFAKRYTPEQQTGGFAPKTDGMGLPIYDGAPSFTPLINVPAKFDSQGAAGDLFKAGYADKGFEVLDKFKPKEDEAFTLGEGQIRYKGDKVVAKGPEKQEALPPSVKEYQFGQKDPAYNDWNLAQKRAGASNQTVINEGQKGLDNTLKVRGDFRSEPIYKAHGEVQSAHSQISTALKQNSPAGDLAGATKLMKILDPGSVVRESELGMAMAASGLLDRATNYASMVMNGTKLTPTQRKDFQKLADALMDESTKQYSAKRGEYKGIAERNKLNVDDILGPEPKSPSAKQVVKTGTYKGRKVIQYSDGTTDYAD